MISNIPIGAEASSIAGLTTEVTELHRGNTEFLNAEVAEDRRGEFQM